jgi:hypothetical protein
MRSNPESVAAIGFYIYLMSSPILADNPWQEGIWKSPPPPQNPDAEFNKQDPYGLSIGARIYTDCSIRWIWHVNGKLYCFNSLTSKAFFIDNPNLYIRGAETFLEQEKEQHEKRGDNIKQ